MIWVWALAYKAWRKVSRHLDMDEFDRDSRDLWFVSKVFQHEDRVNRAFGLKPARIASGPRPVTRIQQQNTTTGGTTLTVTRNFYVKNKAE